MAAAPPLISSSIEISDSPAQVFRDKITSSVRSLVRKLAENVSSGRPASAMSECIYDTAWVSMIVKKHDDQAIWLFPEAFEHLLLNQNEVGSWKKPTDSDLDGILNTMAALLACLKHQRSDVQDAIQGAHLSQRIEKAAAWLQTTLITWDIDGCDQVGFEVLLPSIYRLLQADGLTLSFPALNQLLEIRDQKLAKLDLSLLYSGAQSSIVHCLEALIGLIDFDRLVPLLRKGSMMGSPSATAAFLIHSSHWNDEAEHYLRNVFTNSAGRRSGAFPSAYPAEIFETSWVLSTILETGMSKSFLDADSVSILQGLLSTSLSAGEGSVGFYDTSKALQALCLLNHHEHDVGALIRGFNGNTCFRTYATERNPSFSTNCNVIKALLQSKHGYHHKEHLERAIRYVYQCWHHNHVSDKWNISREYSHMLLSQVLVTYWQVTQKQEYADLPRNLLTEAVTIATQILSRTLRTQGMDDSWGGGSAEVTAYAVLTLATLIELPQSRHLINEVQSAIRRAEAFLTAKFGEWEPSQIWVEKVTYSSPILTDTYCLASLYACQHTSTFIEGPVEEDKKSKHLRMFFSQLPTFRNKENISLIMKTAFVEARQCIMDLAAVQYDIFPRREDADEKYLGYIPVTWIACNISFDAPLSPSLLWDMMEISMLNFQADAYIETTVKSTFEHNLNPVRRLVDRLCRPSASNTRVHHSHSDTAPGVKPIDDQTSQQTHIDATRSEEALSKVEAVLGAYVNRVVSNPVVQTCTPGLQNALRNELAEYLQAQITSIEDDKRLGGSTDDSRQVSASSPTPRPSLFDWARTTGANHTSCPYSYTYFLCLISGGGDANNNNHPGECFRTPTQKFVGRALHRHLATMCRIHNDYGSYARDQAEGTFNSFACAEILGDVQVRGEQVSDVQLREAKDQLLKIGEFERQCLDAAIATLAADGVPAVVMDKIRLFVIVTNLYGEIYVARDIGTRSQ